MLALDFFEKDSDNEKDLALALLEKENEKNLALLLKDHAILLASIKMDFALVSQRY